MAARSKPEEVGKSSGCRLLIRTNHRPFVLVMATTFEEAAEAALLADILEGVIEAHLLKLKAGS